METEDNKIENWQNKHILKLRDFKEPTVIETPDSAELRNIVEPWLTALFQSEHLTLLTGAGISSAVHFLATGNSGAGMGSMDFSYYSNEIKKSSKESALRSGRGEANIEDEIRTLNELIRGLEIVVSTGTKPNIEEKIETLKNDLETGITNFANAVLVSERNIVSSDKEEPAEYLMNFLLSFASRIATRERLNIFTTNYDRIIEFGSELAGLHLIDRFVGTISPIFRSSRLKVTELHPGIHTPERRLKSDSGESLSRTFLQVSSLEELG